MPVTSSEPAAVSNRSPHNGNSAAPTASVRSKRPLAPHRSNTDVSAALAAAAAARPMAQARRPSPSQAAAALAHQRAMSMRPAQKSDAKARQNLVVPKANPRVDGTAASDQDDTTTVNTRALVDLYEAKKKTTGQTQSVRYFTRPPPQIRSPKPLRPGLKSVASSGILPDNPLTLVSSPEDLDGATAGAAAAASGVTERSTYPQLDQDKRVVPRPSASRSNGSVQSQALSIQKSARPAEGGNMLARSTTQRSDMSTASIAPPLLPSNSLSSQRSNQSFVSLSSEAVDTSRNSSVTQLSVPVARSPASFDRLEQRPVPPSDWSRRSIDVQQPQQSVSHRMSVDSLANAIVASSLASSRASSPMKGLSAAPNGGPGGLGGHQRPMHSQSQPQPQSHHRLHLFHRNQSSEQISRTPSPAKAMRTTMRAPAPSSDQDASKGQSSKGYPSSTSSGRHHHHHLVRKHPNKHHEGDRKRYRTQISERERRRYEGVWAANRGLHVPSLESSSSASLQKTISASSTVAVNTGLPDTTSSSTAVLNIVAREIWRRSRLTDDVLAEVWDLVAGKGGVNAVDSTVVSSMATTTATKAPDPSRSSINTDTDVGAMTAGSDVASGTDRLTREEFVVGMWLIDQRLQGNKLPVKVSESVWGSVRRLEGIKLPRYT